MGAKAPKPPIDSNAGVKLDQAQYIADALLATHFYARQYLDSILESLCTYGLLTGEGNEVRGKMKLGIESSEEEDNPIFIEAYNNLPEDERKMIVKLGRLGRLDVRTQAFLKRNNLLE